MPHQLSPKERLMLARMKRNPTTAAKATPATADPATRAERLFRALYGRSAR